MKRRLFTIMAFLCFIIGTSRGSDYVSGGDGLSISENFIQNRATDGNVREIWSNNAKMGFNLSQTVELPNGVYTLSMQAMYRASLESGTATNCVLYAETTGKVYNTPIANFGDYSAGESLGGVASAMTTDAMNYANKIPYFVVTDGRVNIGARSLGQLAYCTNGYWFIWDPSTLLLSDVTDSDVLTEALADVKAEAKTILDEAGESDAKITLQAAYDNATATSAGIVALKEAIREYYPNLATADNPIDVSSLLINPKYEETAMMVATNNTNTGVTYPMVQPTGWICSDNVTTESSYHFYHVVKGGETFDGNSNSDYDNGGNTLYMRYAWDGAAPVMTAKQTVRLPEGNYRISVPARKNGGDITVTVKYTFAGATETNTVTTAWTEYSKNFTIDETNRDITIALEFSRANVNVGTEQAYFGGVTLLSYGDPLEATRKLLRVEIDKLDAYRNTIPSGLWDENTGLFAKALADANALMTGTPEVATVEEMTKTLQDYSVQASAMAPAYDALNKLIALCTEYAAEDYSTVETEDVRTALTNAIGVATTGKETAEDAAAIESLRSALETARQTFVEAAYPKEGKTFDMTYKIVNAAVTSASGWTNGRTASGQQYPDAPDNTYLDITWGQTLNISQTITNLPEGLYALKAVTRSGNSDETVTTDIYPVAYIYAGSQQATLQQAGNADNELGNGWGWTTVAPVTVTEGSLTIGLYAECSGQRWAGADNFTLTRAFDSTIPEAMLASIAGLAKAANDMNVAPLGTEEANAITASVNKANQTSASTPLSTMREILATLQTAVEAVEPWREAYDEAKKPLVAAFERFEQDYNDGANGPLRPMSAEAWNTLLEAVKTAAEAKDVTDSYDGFADAAAAFNAAMDAVEPSIVLYAGYTSFISALSLIDDDNLLAAVNGVNTDAYHASDAKVEEAVLVMDEAFATYKNTQNGSFSLNALLGDNLDFETAPTVTDERNTQAFEIPEWNNVFVSNPTDGNLQYVFKTQATDVAEGVTTAHSLRMRSKWDQIETKIQIWKDTYLPSGEYTLSFYVKEPQTSGIIENLCYYELDGVRTEITAGASWEHKTVNLSVSKPTPFSLSFGFLRDTNSGGGHDADIYVDDVELVCQTETAFARALAAAKAETASLAAQSAVAEYDGREEELTEAGTVDAAVKVLLNSVTIAQNGEMATSLIKNVDFTGGTVSQPTQGDGGGRIVGPADWTLECTIGGYNDVFVDNKYTAKGENGEDTTINGDYYFNLWAGTIACGELMQTLTSLPNGVYRLSAEVLTDANEGNSWVAVYGAPTDESAIGRAKNVTSADFTTYGVDFVVANHTATIGVRTDAYWFKIKNFTLQFVAPADTEDATILSNMDNGRLYQKAFVDRNALEVDLSAFTNANGATVYLDRKNALIKAASTAAVTNTQNVIVDGACENFVLTDKEPFSTIGGFTATNASYSREMTNEWGTLVLPYAVTSDENVTFYRLATVHSGTDGYDYMSFEEMESVPANTPVAFRRNVTASGAEGETETLASTVVTFEGTGAEVAAVNGTSVSAETGATNWTADGYYDSRTITAADNSDELARTYYVSNNMFMNATRSLTVSPFRAVYVVTESTGVSRFLIDFDDLATGISDASSEVPALAVFGERGALRMVAGRTVRYAVYTLGGMLVEQGTLQAGEETERSLSAGIYIVNGLKVQVK